MPTAAPLPIPQSMLPAGPLNQFDWLSLAHNEFNGADQTPLMRGTGGAFAYWQQRQVQGPGTVAWPREMWLQSRQFSRGAGAFSPKFGVLNINPIGAGVYAPYKLPPFAGPGGRYAAGAIFFGVQSVPTSMHAGPTMSVESLDALLATSSVAGMIATTG